MSVFSLLLIVHALAATVWTGGHLVLALGVLPRALQVITGLWMGRIDLPGYAGLLSPADPIGMLLGVKLLLLLLARPRWRWHARLWLIPSLTDENISGLAWHIRGITTLAIAFVVVGALIRLGA